MAATQLVETVTGDTMAALLAARDAATGVDMVELRLDGVTDLDVGAALRGRRLPVIATCRPTWEGGRFSGGEQERRQVLLQALSAGAEFVDVEWRADFSDVIAANPSRIVLSSHDFDGVPADLPGRARAMRQCGAAVIKIAVKAARLGDSIPLLEIARGGNAVVIAMGDAGVSSRLLATKFGSRWTYAGNAVAPGQISSARMIGEFRFDAIGPETAVYGLVGGHATSSRSPAMHNAAFEAAGLDAVYVPLVPSDFDDFLAFADAIGVRGVSVTIPFKLDALRAARRSDELTHLVGAANTLRRFGADVAGEWEATNTDVEGFLAPLEKMHPGPLRDVRAAVLGAGGASRAVTVALRARGALVTVHARRVDQAAQVAAACGGHAGAWPPARGFLGPAGELHAARRSIRAGDVTAARRAVRREARIRPHVRCRGVAPAARGSRCGMSDARRAADAGGSSRAPVRVVDGAAAGGGSDARRRQSDHAHEPHSRSSKSSPNGRRSCRCARSSSPICSRPCRPS